MGDGCHENTGVRRLSDTRKEGERAFDQQTTPIFENEQIEDILFIVTYSGVSPC